MCVCLRVISEKDTKKRGSSCGLAGDILDKPSKRELHSVRKSPLYTNAYLEAPDGQQLCVTDNKHADWYVQKGKMDTSHFILFGANTFKQFFP